MRGKKNEKKKKKGAGKTDFSHLSVIIINLVMVCGVWRLSRTLASFRASPDSRLSPARSAALHQDPLGLQHIILCAVLCRHQSVLRRRSEPRSRATPSKHPMLSSPVFLSFVEVSRPPQDRRHEKRHALR